MTLNDLFKNTTYDDTLFSAEAKSAIESRIFMKSVRGSEVPYVSQKIAYRLNYADIKYHLYEVYKHGMKIIADRYPRFIVDDFYSLNLSFKETASEEFSLEGGFSGKFVCTVKCASAETLTATIMCTDKSYRTKVDKDYVPIGVSVDYSVILMAIVQEIEDRQFVLTEASLIERFYEKLFDAISDAFFSEINNAKTSIPEKGNKRFLKVFDAMLAFCARALNAIKARLQS